MKAPTSPTLAVPVLGVPVLVMPILVMLALLAAACGSSTEPGAAAPSSDAPAASTPSTEAAAAPDPDQADPGAEPPPPLHGDLQAATVTFNEILVLDEPIDTVVAPNGEWWIAQRGGVVVVVDPASGEVGDSIVDISAETHADNEQGLLGMAVDHQALYLNFTDRAGDTHVEAWLLDGAGRPDQRHILLTIDQPFENHNGGGLAIGPDGHLYIGVGDGGSANDPLDAGQDPATLLGSILRIDPTPGRDDPYAVPTDNPFSDGVDGRPEIFLVGVRNPWRFSFDPRTDDLWVADVGQNLFEEVSMLRAGDGWGVGANLGWNRREGFHEFTGRRPEGNVDPVFEYGHNGDPGGCSVTGGHVYRGSAIPDLIGSYVFGDYCTSRLWAVSVADGAVTFRDLGAEIPGAELAGFGLDPNGEIVALSLAGPVARIIAR